MTEPQLAGRAALDELIGEIAEEFTQKLVQGEQPDVEDYARKHPAHAAVLRQLLPALETLRPDRADTESPQLTDSVLGDFRILREIGRGGMGVVYEAEQLSLRRRVALKILPFAAVLDETHLKRFKNEALAAAQLDHPNIVDVLAVGCDRGVHYYAMRFVEGRTLAQMIQALDYSPQPADQKPAEPKSGSAQAAAESTLLAGQSTEGPSATADRFRRAAEIGRQVAEGLDHAHQNGIIHRDIKPSNLIIDAKGKPWICDFGLAHVEHDAVALTRTGDIVGTLRYLSPEQVTARRVVMDHRVDTYALGASLYELLTLRPAFDGKTRGDLIRQILSEEPCPPTKINPRIPVELEIILLKAMAKEPEDRYPTTLELAEDLQRFLEDKPIRARRPSLRQRLARWSRQHRTLVRSTALILLLGISALMLAVVLIDQARRDAVDARTQMEREFHRAEAERLEADRLRVLEEHNFQKALEAVDGMLTQVAQKDLAHVPGMLPIRQKLLEDALALYQQFLEQRRHDRVVRLETVKAYGRVGEIRMMLGHHEAALSTYETEITLLNEVLEQEQSATLFRLQLAIAFHNLGMLQFARGKLAEAESAYRRSLAINTSLAADEEERPAVFSLLAGTHNNLGNVLNQRGDRREALGHYQKAIDFYEKLVETDPKSSTYRTQLATCHLSVARFFQLSGEAQKAEGHDRRALELHSALVAENPSVASYRRHLASNHCCLASSLRLAREYEESKQHFAKALELQTSLKHELSVIPDFRKELARTHSNFSLLFKDVGDDPRAITHAEKALELRAKLAEELPGVPACRMDWGRSRRHLADLLVRTEKSAQAVEQWKEALPLFQKLAAEFPNVPEYRSELAFTHSKLAETLHRMGETADVEDHFQQAVELQSRLTEESPGVPSHRNSLADTWWRRGNFLLSQNRPETAVADFDRAIALKRELVKEHPESVKPREDLAGCLYNLAMAQGRLKSLDRAEAALRESLMHYAMLMKSQSAEARYRPRLLAISSILGRLLKTRNQSTDDACDLLILAISDWLQEDKPAARLWFDRAVRSKPAEPSARLVYDRLLVEAQILMGFEPDRPDPR